MRRAASRSKVATEVIETATTIAAAAIRTYPLRRMAVIRTVGDPTEVAQHAIGRLYGAVYALHRARARAGRDFQVGAVCGIWPDATLLPQDEWHGIWGLEVPDNVRDEELSRDESDQPIELETWPGGQYAEIVHRGPYATEPETIALLHRFVEEHGYVVAGPHEEEYLTRPGADEPATRIRYRVKPAA